MNRLTHGPSGLSATRDAMELPIHAASAFDLLQLTPKAVDPGVGSVDFHGCRLVSTAAGPTHRSNDRSTYFTEASADSVVPSSSTGQCAIRAIRSSVTRSMWL